MARQNIPWNFTRSGVEWEPPYGTSQAVRVGNHVMVTGMARIDEEGKIVGDIAAQTRRAPERVNVALELAGASLEDVVRTRNLLVNIDDWEIVMGIHGEVFESIRPASVLFQVNRFIDPTWLIEIEVDAIIDRDQLCQDESFPVTEPADQGFVGALHGGPGARARYVHSDPDDWVVSQHW